MKYVATTGDRSYEIEVNSGHEVVVDGNRLPVDFQSVADQPVFSLIVGGRSYEAYVHPSEVGLDVVLGGRLYHIDIEDERNGTCAKRPRERHRTRATTTCGLPCPDWSWPCRWLRARKSSGVTTW